ncbi:MAG: DUF6624 domain-containing protein [Bacteroidota bacterium]
MRTLLIWILTCLAWSGSVAAQEPAEDIALPDVRARLLEMEALDQQANQAVLNTAPGDTVAQSRLRAMKDSLYIAHAEEMAVLLDEHGWPGVSLVGKDGANAAFLLAQHADARPKLQARSLPLLAEAVRAGDAPPRHLAYLTDRVRVGSDRPQVYGTQLGYDDEACPYPKPLEDPEGVDERRQSVGLEPLAEYVNGMSEMLGRGDRCVWSADEE